MRILFVCSGNICRSPMAEALFVHMARERGVLDRFEADSAGLHGYHEGEAADPRTRRLGAKHGVEVTSIARQIEPPDIAKADLVLAMDRGHQRELTRMSPPEHRRKIRLMRGYDRPGASPDVDDPYYGGPEGFDRMYDVLETCCRNLLDALLRGDAAAPDAGSA
ncbi:MAG TPA: low molecular weight protein-tyrosine-phosphatase [Vicinamibacteria bacterium]|nr:low molecular weight protein-tyrosine-phosphatase [Vicinamibacteria bacterium]